MRDIEMYPRLAIALPHPELPDTYAIDANTGTLPGVRMDEVDASPERLALVLAEKVNADKYHKVDKNVREYAIINFFAMQRPAHADLARPYEWLDCRIDTIREQYAALRDPSIPRRTHAHREIVERPAMDALSIFTLMSWLRTAREHEVTRSFFFEQPGMYGLPLASDLLASRSSA